MLVIMGILALDLVSKSMAERLTNTVSILPGFLYFNFVKNFGMAWSFLSGQTVFLSLVAAVAILAMGYYLIYRKPTGLKKFAIELMVAGALGNLIDRLSLGYVRDFIDTYIFGYDFPIFNVADCALTIGVLFLLIVEYQEERHGKNTLNCG